MDNRFLGLIEKSIQEHWDLPAFSDYNGQTYHFKDFARRIEKFHIILEHAGIKKGDKVAIIFLDAKAYRKLVTEYGFKNTPDYHNWIKYITAKYKLNKSNDKYVYTI